MIRARWQRWSRIAAMLGTLVGVVAPSPPAICAQGQQGPTEYELKAVFLFNFAQFVEWPATAFDRPDAPLVIGVLGTDPFGSRLEEAVKGETVQGHPLEIRRFARAEEIDTCHILFLGSKEGPGLESILSQLKFRPILTVGESENFARTGGMIGFVTDRNRIRLRINRGAAEAASLVLSSRLLRPAEIVATGGR
ncbi:MAG TPA: YfiR family protein [Gemmatimonadales bacterium]|nr:YfiR family protein [Gemmatimonadales bacterium]